MSEPSSLQQKINTVQTVVWQTKPSRNRQWLTAVTDIWFPRENKILRFVFWFHPIVSGLAKLSQSTSLLQLTGFLLLPPLSSTVTWILTWPGGCVPVSCNDYISDCCFYLNTRIFLKVYQDLEIKIDTLVIFPICGISFVQWNFTTSSPTKDTDHLSYQHGLHMKHVALLKNPLTWKGVMGG